MNLLKLGQDQSAFSGVVEGNSKSAFSGVVRSNELKVHEVNGENC